MTSKQIEKKQAEENKKYEAAKQIAEILAQFDEDAQSEIIELVTEDE